MRGVECRRGHSLVGSKRRTYGQASQSARSLFVKWDRNETFNSGVRRIKLGNPCMFSGEAVGSCRERLIAVLPIVLRTRHLTGCSVRW